MEYRIEEKESFKVVGVSRKFKYENAYEEVPKLWKEFNMSGNKDICSMYESIMMRQWNVMNSHI